MKSTPEQIPQSKRDTSASCEHMEAYVLVAEDDSEFRRLMSSVLSDEGYSVRQAKDGNDMLKAVQACKEAGHGMFDLIITDIRMPGLTGLEVLARLRAAGCQTPAIVISSGADPSQQLQARALKAVFMQKPFALERLRALARNALSGSHTNDAD